MHFEILTQKKKLQLICFDDLILWSDLLSLMKIWCSFCFWRRELWGLLNYRSKFQKHFLLLWCGQNLKREKVFVNASDVVEDWSSSRKLGWLLRLETRNKYKNNTKNCWKNKDFSSSFLPATCAQLIRFQFPKPKSWKPCLSL